jgi:hypothetical protein
VGVRENLLLARVADAVSYYEFIIVRLLGATPPQQLAAPSAHRYQLVHAGKKPPGST